jgi:hypothetical protein
MFRVILTTAGVFARQGLPFLKAHTEVTLVILGSAWRYTAKFVTRDGSEPGENGAALIGVGLDEFLSEAASRGDIFLIVADTPQGGIDPVPCILARIRDCCVAVAKQVSPIDRGASLTKQI